jgi:single stranded DNA-binding protein
MRLAVDGPEEHTTYVDVTAFSALATNCAEYLEKGRAVAVSGRLAYSEWEAQDGSKRSKHEVIATRRRLRRRTRSRGRHARFLSPGPARGAAERMAPIRVLTWPLRSPAPGRDRDQGATVYQATPGPLMTDNRANRRRIIDHGRRRAARSDRAKARLAGALAPRRAGARGRDAAGAPSPTDWTPEANAERRYARLAGRARAAQGLT